MKKLNVILSFVLVLAFASGIFGPVGHVSVRAAADNAPAKPSIAIKSVKDDTAVKITIPRPKVRTDTASI